VARGYPKRGFARAKTVGCGSAALGSMLISRSRHSSDLSTLTQSRFSKPTPSPPLQNG
jgi:hypothetical protein